MRTMRYFAIGAGLACATIALLYALLAHAQFEDPAESGAPAATSVVSTADAACVANAIVYDNVGIESCTNPIVIDAASGTDELTVSAGAVVNTGTLDQRGTISNTTGSVIVDDVLGVSSTGQLQARTNSATIFQAGSAGTQYFVVQDPALPRVQVQSGVSFGYSPWIVAKTANYTVTAADSGAYFTNLGAAGNVNFTLPAASNSTPYIYRFAVATEVAGDDVTITSVGDDVIQIGSFTSGAADCIDAVGLGSQVECYAVSTTQWMCKCDSGTCDTTCP
jgi:hypothetical protein